jgi:hypothetical protein
MFEDAFDLGADSDVLRRIPDKITHHAYVAYVWQLDKDGDVWAMRL